MKAPIQTRWLEPELIKPPDEYTALLGLNPVAACGLVRRGINDLNQARAFLDPAYYTPADPLDLPDVEIAAERLLRALKNRELIAVWGDFDVDGQTSTTLLVETLRRAGANVTYHIPVRERESHGVNLPKLRELINNGVQLVLTCDTGISAHDSVVYAQSRGVDFIISDHHTLPESLPPALAVVNPQRLPEHHSLRPLPGVGVAFLLASVMAQRLHLEDMLEDLVDLAALGTLADLAPLTGEARYLVQRGLRALRNPHRTALQAMMERADLDPAHLNEEHIGFILAPRLNALGRLSDANPVVEFLTTVDAAYASVFAARLEGLNAQRRFLTEQVFEGAMNQIEREPSLIASPVLILTHPTWPGGVVGIVASRLADLFQRPVILLTGPPGGVLRGSARSVEPLDITSAISSAADLLLGYGGHPMAAGMAMEARNLPAFRRRVAAHIEKQLGGIKTEREIQIDAFITMEEITLDFAAGLETLAPFGPGNPPLVLAARNLAVAQSTMMGRHNEHLALLLEDENGHTRKAVWWQGSRDLLPQGRFDLAFYLRANNYRGQPEIQIEWLAARDIPETIAAAASAAAAPDWLDLRAEPDPLACLPPLDPKDVIAWAARDADLPFRTAGLHHLSPCGTLIIWKAPAGRTELAEALERVQPKRVIFCASPCQPDEVRSLLENIAGMVRFSMRQRKGVVGLQDMAAALNQRLLTVELGLYWLASRGYIRILQHSDQTLLLAEGGVPNPEDAERLEGYIQDALGETAAFRAWYLRVDASQLVKPYQPDQNLH